MDAGQLMQCEFAQFHLHHHHEGQQQQQTRKTTETKRGNGGIERHGIISITEVANEAAGGNGELREDHHLPEMTISGPRKTQSVLLEGSVSRHNIYLGYQKFERSVTTILATMLSKETCTRLLLLLRGEEQQQQLRSHDLDDTSRMDMTAAAANCSGDGYNTNEGTSSRKLQVVTIEVLLELMGGMQGENSTDVEEV